MIPLCPTHPEDSQRIRQGNCPTSVRPNINDVSFLASNNSYLIWVFAESAFEEPVTGCACKEEETEACTQPLFSGSPPFNAVADPQSFPNIRPCRNMGHESNG